MVNTTALKIFNFKQKGMNTIFNYIFVSKLNPNFIDLCLRNLDYAIYVPHSISPPLEDLIKFTLMMCFKFYMILT